MSEQPRNPFGPDVHICGTHQARMKSAIMAAGLWPRVSKTREDLERRDRANNPFDPCPLILLHNMVYGKCRHTAALNEVTLYRGCPVCVFDVPQWIDEAAAAVAARLVTLDIEAEADRENNRRLEEAARRP